MNLIDGRNKVLTLEAAVQEMAKINPGLHLHVGCGPRVLEGFINCDRYHYAHNVIPADMTFVPFKSGSIDTILCCHAFEHLSFRNGRVASQEFGRVLRKGGILYLSIPDAKLCYEAALSSSGQQREWYLRTIHGYQQTPGTSMNDDFTPNDLGQYHLSGWFKDDMENLFRKSGLNLTESWEYDGYGTPSRQYIFIKA